mmetsp:Transcript_3134/g.7826  ORF Transcript_3134/g.7826 Transcript_3134/m.7826 type:complete len:271 (-) Transcript_3134:107-919(-)
MSSLTQDNSYWLSTNIKCSPRCSTSCSSASHSTISELPDSPDPPPPFLPDSLPGLPPDSLPYSPGRCPPYVRTCSARRGPAKTAREHHLGTLGYSAIISPPPSFRIPHARVASAMRFSSLPSAVAVSLCLASYSNTRKNGLTRARPVPSVSLGVWTRRGNRLSRPGDITASTWQVQTLRAFSVGSLAHACAWGFAGAEKQGDARQRRFRHFGSRSGSKACLPDSQPDSPRMRADRGRPSNSHSRACCSASTSPSCRRFPEFLTPVESIMN